jgi:hypothetical protein
MLEGGYDLDALGASTRAVLGVLTGAEGRPEPTSSGGPGRAEVDAVADLWRSATAS